MERTPPKASQHLQIPDELWDKVKPLLPPGKPHPLGCHRPRVDDPKALDSTGIRSSSSAHRRFQEWTQAGVFQTLWAQGLLDYDEARDLGQEFGYNLHIRARNEEAQALKRQVGYKARRWVVY